MLKNLIIKIALFLVLAVNIVNLSFNTYDRIANKPVEKHKIVEAGHWYPLWPIFILLNVVWKKINGGSIYFDKPPNPCSDC